MLYTRLRSPRFRDYILSHAPSPSSATENDSGGDDSDDDPEDFFSSFIKLPNIFPDDILHNHGEPGQYLLYSSIRYGDLRIMVPSPPDQSGGSDKTEENAGLTIAKGRSNDVEKGPNLWAHFLWTAGLVVAEGIELADSGLESDDVAMWKVQGEKVLELGAGAGLPSVVAALANASSVTITDHPSSPALGPTGAISFNVKHNLPSTTNCSVDIRPHEWGTAFANDPWAASSKSSFTRIIAADCYWMGDQHENLARSMKWFLAPTGRIWVVAPFHTGRPIVAGFFEAAVKLGLEIESIHERDLNTSAEEGGEVRRKWITEREGEGPDNRKRWCVVAILKHAGSDTLHNSLI